MELIGEVIDYCEDCQIYKCACCGECDEEAEMFECAGCQDQFCYADCAGRTCDFCCGTSCDWCNECECGGLQGNSDEESDDE